MDHIEWKKGDVAVIRPTWHQAGFEMEVLAPAVCVDGQWWVPVRDDDDDPTFYKEAALEKKP